MTPEEDYRHRIAVLKTLDISAFLDLVPADKRAALDAVSPVLRPAAILGALHKARLLVPEMTDAEREESRAWLERHGLMRK